MAIMLIYLSLICPASSWLMIAQEVDGINSLDVTFVTRDTTLFFFCDRSSCSKYVTKSRYFVVRQNNRDFW